jgi:hypothetical protein
MTGIKTALTVLIGIVLLFTSACSPAPEEQQSEETEQEDMSEESSRELAEEFVKNSPTFAFDGMEETLELTDTLVLRCPYCWTFVFEFDCSSAGYGNRTGVMTAQVITHHRAEITVIKHEITSAVIDGEWDMLRQMLTDESGEPVTITAFTVAQMLENPVYDTEITIAGEVSLLGELLCPCFSLTSEGKTVHWSGLMVENDGTERRSRYRRNRKPAIRSWSTVELREKAEPTIRGRFLGKPI